MASQSPPPAGRARLLAAYAALGALFLWPLVLHPSWFGGTSDWGFFHFMEEAFLRALREHDTMALWNPWYCGGSPGLANPQSQVLSPFFWISWLGGSALGLKARILGYFALGAWGAHRLAAELGVRTDLGRFAAGATFATGGFFAWHVSGGHAAFLPFYLLPLTWLCHRRGVLADSWSVSLAWAVGLAACWTLMVFDGSVYPVPFSVLLLGVQSAWDLLAGPTRRVRVNAIWVPAAAGMLFGLLAAPKLWLMFDLLSEFPRDVASKDRLFPRDLVKMLLSFRVERKYPPHVYVWPEYGATIGPVAIALAAWIALREPGRQARLLVTLGLFGALLAGNHGPWSPFELLRRIPPFGSLRLPSRYVVVVILLLGLLLGFAVDRLAQLYRDREAPAASGKPPAAPSPAGAWLRLSRAAVTSLLVIWIIDGTPWLWVRWIEGVAGALTVAAAGGVVALGPIVGSQVRRHLPAGLLLAAGLSLAVTAAFGGGLFYDAFSRPPEPASRVGDFSHKRGAPAHMWRYVWKNWGSVQCYDPLHVPTGAIRRTAADDAQSWLVPPAAGDRPIIVRWSPNSATFRLRVHAPAILVWNMNYHRAWRVTGAAAAEPWRGLVSTRVEPGAIEVELRYSPRRFETAVMVSLATCAALTAFFLTLAVRGRKRPGA